MPCIQKSDIMQMVEEEDVEFIRLQFTDIFGNMKKCCHHQQPAGKSAG